MAFKTSPQCGHVAAVDETGCLQVGQLVSVAILFLLVDIGVVGGILRKKTHSLGNLFE